MTDKITSPVEPVETSVEPVETAVEPVETQNTSTSSTSEGHTPVLRVVRGDLAPEELAALVAVVAARNAAAAHAATQTKPKVRSQWGHPARMARPPHRFGPDLWRQSAFGR